MSENRILDAAQPSADLWRSTVEQMLATTEQVASDDPRESLDRLIDWHVAVAMDPLVSSDARALVQRGRGEVAAQPSADPTDPGHDVTVLREHVRHLERRIRELHAPTAQPSAVITYAMVRAACIAFSEWLDEGGTPDGAMERCPGMYEALRAAMGDAPEAEGGGR